MKLNLTRPIIFFDIEATGLNIAQDRIVELCYIKVFPNGNEASETLRFNPVNSNHFDIPLLVEEFIRAGVDFDISKCRFVDVQNIYHKLEQRTLSAAYKFYCGKDLEEAHTALADTKATYEVLQNQLDRYPNDLKNDIAFLAEFSRRNNNVDLAGRIVLNEQKVPVINFGKYKGRPVMDVLRHDPGYYAWIMQGDFPQNTKQTFMRFKLQLL